MNELNTSPIPAAEDIATLAEETSSVKKAGKSKKFLKIAVGLFAVIGLTVVALVISAFIAAQREQPVSHSIDELHAVEKIMEHTYGKYSASKRGWTYVSEDGDTYLVTVVQQKKIETVGKADELYIVTSGVKIASGAAAPKDEEGQTLYGVFKVTASNDELEPISRPVNFGGTVKLSPERVKFVAFNQDHWGWVLKHVSEGIGVETTVNEVLVAGEKEIHSAAQFISAYDNTKDVIASYGSCEQANAAYAVWKEQSAHKATPSDTEAQSAVAPTQSASEPDRCTKYVITFRTDPLTEKFFTALHLVATGIRDGQPMEQKKWKVMFDQKSFTYMLPKELEEEYERFTRPD